MKPIDRHRSEKSMPQATVVESPFLEDKCIAGCADADSGNCSGHGIGLGRAKPQSRRSAPDRWAS